MKTHYSFFKTKDNASIRYAQWTSSEKNNRGTIVYLSGRTEFIEKNLKTVEELLNRGFHVFSMDWRGQGLSHRMLDNSHKGHIKNYRQYLDDLEQFVFSIVKPEAQSPLILLAHSMGGHIGLRFLHDFPHVFERAFMTAPMIDIKIDGHWKERLIKIFVSLGHFLGMDHLYVPGTGDYGPKNREFEGNIVTSDFQRFSEEHQLIESDPRLALGGPTFGWLYATFKSIEILKKPHYVSEIQTPVLLLSSGSDEVVSNAAQKDLYLKLPKGVLKVVEGAKHEILRERDELREQFWQLFDENT